MDFLSKPFFVRNILSNAILSFSILKFPLMFPFKNFAISTGKLPCWSLSSVKLLDLQRLIYINYLFVNKRTKIKKFY